MISVPPEPEERMSEERPYAVGGDEDALLGSIWKTKPSEEVLEGEITKEELARQHHAKYFEVEDPSDDLDDDEAWDEYLRSTGGGGAA